MRGTEQTATAMNHCRTSTRARAHGKSQSSALTRLTGVAILLIAATAWPMAALAADPTVETQSNPVIVYVVLILLFAALTSGIFFASPLRSRLMPSTAVPATRKSHLVTPQAIEAELPPFEMQTQPITPQEQQMQAAWPPQPSSQPQPMYQAQPIYEPQPTYQQEPTSQPLPTYGQPQPPYQQPQPQPTYPQQPAESGNSPWSTGGPQAGPWTHGRPPSDGQR